MSKPLASGFPLSEFWKYLFHEKAKAYSRKHLFVDIIVVVFLLCICSEKSAQAGVLDWLKSKRSNDSPTEIVKTDSGTVAVSAKDASLPNFFATEADPDITGKSLNLIKFSESHWVHSKNNLETITKSIIAKIQTKKFNEIATKLTVVDLQTFKSAIKSAATGLTSLSNGNKALEGLLGELNRVITAPGEETLSNFEKVIGRIGSANENQYRITKAYIVAAEGLVRIGAESYQTLELIPSLSLGPLDIFIQLSKQLMKQVQSGNEAVKGLLLNIQNGCEQVASTLEIMSATLRTTLRFSDQFAFKQYPLVNLPVPTREKLFSQLGILKDIVKGVNNTLSIGDSHVKNSAQQFSHMIDGAVAKMRDALKYQESIDISSGNLSQLSNYGLNQVSGLFQRVKEGLAELKIEMAKQAREKESKSQPQIALETNDESINRKTSEATDGRLPLFLLGQGKKPNETQPPTGSAGNFSPSGGQTTVLYAEKSDFSENKFVPDEMRILQREIGSPISYIKEAKQEISSSDDSVSEAANNEWTQLKNSNQAAGIIEENKHDESIAKADLPADSEARDFELLRMDTPPTLSDSSDLIPMLRLDDSQSSGGENDF